MGKVSKNWETLYQQLRMDIILGAYRPRERLIEDDIIARNKVTRHAVRRAFDELERMALVTRQPNKGIQVRDYSTTQIKELYEVRECLEEGAALRFALPASAETLSELRDLAEQHSVASRDQRFADVFSLNNTFHETLYGAAGNKEMADAIRHFTFATHPIRTGAFSNPELREEAISEHFAMVDAIEDGDRKKLAAIIRTHIARPRDFYIENVMLPGALV